MSSVGESLESFAKTLDQAGFALDVAQSLIWISGWYLVYRLWNQKWALLILWGDIINFIVWIYSLRHHFIGFPEKAPSEDFVLIDMVTRRLLIFVSSVLITLGAAKGLMLLQRRSREMNRRTTPEDPGPRSSPPAQERGGGEQGE